MKERDFSGLLGGIHLPICRAIRERWGRPADPPYLFTDLHGGPGDLNYNGRYIKGSPLIASGLLQSSGLPYQTLHFEKDPEVAAGLRTALIRTGSHYADVRAEQFETGMKRWLEANGRQSYRYGVVYSDPISDPIPVVTFNQVASLLPRVDLMAYVSATNQYKRANANGQGHGRKLADDIRAVKKQHVLIREPARAEQYTFVVWTNWTDFPKWHARGFYDLASPQGQRILDRLNCTKAELHEKANTPLSFDGTPAYRSYREYLKHPRFLKIRAEVFERAAGMCERCQTRLATEPHHLRYPPWGSFDVPENMIAVCHPCHCEIHGKAA